jgi:glucokinase
VWEYLPVDERGGIDLGGTKIEAVIVDSANTVLASARRPTPQKGGPEAVAAELDEALRAAATTALVEPAELMGVGVGSPGVVDTRSGAVSSARNLPDWNGTFGLASTLSSTLGTRVRVGNDVQVATNAEFELGAGREFKSLIGVFWGTGVGGGLILGGKPWLGRGGSGEIGHMVIKQGGRRCPCGRRGCLEAYAGRASMEARARRLAKNGEKTKLFKIMEERGRTRLTSGVWQRALDHNDKLAEEIFDEAVAALGTGIASAMNLLDVEAVIIGGGLGVRFGQPLADRIADTMQPHLFHDSNPPAVRAAALGDLGGAIGAALLARRQTAGRRPAAARANR